jgi:hypothetical protein
MLRARWVQLRKAQQRAQALADKLRSRGREAPDAALQAQLEAARGDKRSAEAHAETLRQVTRKP